MLKKYLKSIAATAMLAVMTVAMSPAMPAQAQQTSIAATDTCPAEAGFTLTSGGIIAALSASTDSNLRGVDRNGDGYFCEKYVETGNGKRLVQIDNNVPFGEIRILAEVMEVEVVNGSEKVTSSKSVELEVAALAP